MDVEAATRRLLQPNASGFLSDAATARRNGKDIDPRRLLREVEGAAVADVVVRRNLVFAEWTKGTQNGVLIASWNQDHKVANLDVWA